MRIMRPLDKLLPWVITIFATAVIAALVAAWMLQKPLRALAQAVGRFGRGQPVPRTAPPRVLRLVAVVLRLMVRLIV